MAKKLRAINAVPDTKYATFARSILPTLRIAEAINTSPAVAVTTIAPIMAVIAKPEFKFITPNHAQ
jgi:hypothetical protein